jgi:hypothetical protein
MRLARVSVFVEADTAMRPHPSLSECGARVACLELGASVGVGVSGSPAAMRRLGAAVIATAAAAEELSDQPGPGAAPRRVVAGL